MIVSLERTYFKTHSIAQFLLKDSKQEPFKRRCGNRESREKNKGKKKKSEKERKKKEKERVLG